MVQLYDQIGAKDTDIRFIGGTDFLVSQVIDRGDNGTVTHFELHNGASKIVGQIGLKVSFDPSAKPKQ